MQAIAIRLQAIAIRLEAIAIRLEAIAIRLEAIAIRLEAIALRFEAVAIGWASPRSKRTDQMQGSPARRTKVHSFLDVLLFGAEMVLLLLVLFIRT